MAHQSYQKDPQRKPPNKQKLEHSSKNNQKPSKHTKEKQTKQKGESKKGKPSQSDLTSRVMPTTPESHGTDVNNTTSVEKVNKISKFSIQDIVISLVTLQVFLKVSEQCP